MNEQQELLRQCANEALVALVLPMVFEAIGHAADCVAHDLDISQNDAKQAIIAQWLKYIAKYPSKALDNDILSIWANYHPAMDYESNYTLRDDSDDDDIAPYGTIAA